MNEIIWPEKYTPGTTDNDVFNEVIVAGWTVPQVWPHLCKASEWPTYYHNARNIVFEDSTVTELGPGTRFRFTTFELDVQAEVVEYVAPAAGNPGRLA